MTRDFSNRKTAEESFLREISGAMLAGLDIRKMLTAITAGIQHVVPPTITQRLLFSRMGGTRSIPVDVRLIAATNRDLSAMMKEGTFRSDLYYYKGGYLLCSGEVKISMSSSGGKTLILRLAKPGEMLGLMAAVSGLGCEATVETLEPCSVSLIRPNDFAKVMTEHPEVYQAILRQASAQYYGTCEQIRTIARSASCREKLARLLLHWSSEGRDTADGSRTNVVWTHEQMAECIGSTRETITRTLSEFKAGQLVTFKGTSMFIPSRIALEAVTGD